MSRIEEYELTDHGVKLRDDTVSLPTKNHKNKALEKKKHLLTGRSQKEQMRFTRQNRDYQSKIGRAWND